MCQNLVKDPVSEAFVRESLPGSFIELVEKVKLDDAALTLAIADLDGCGALNETFGTTVGDAVLRVLVEHLYADAPEGTGVYRYSAEDILILLPGIEKEQAFLWLEQKRQQFARERTVHDGEKDVTLTVTFSGSIAAYPDDDTTPTGLLRKAYDALFRAKTSGRNKLCLAREERMVLKTSYYTPGQLQRLSSIAKRKEMGEAALLREALDDLLMKYGL